MVEVNKMKRFAAKFALVIMCAMTFVSCTKEGINLFEGRYSYKISGLVSLIPSAYVNAPAAVSPTVIPLYPEQGQMHINVKDKDKNVVIISFNDIKGSVITADATIESDEIKIGEGMLKTASVTDGTNKIGSGIVLYSASGKLYGNQIIMQLVYNGELTLNGTKMTIVDSKIDCVATRN